MKKYNTFIDKWTHGDKYYLSQNDRREYYGPCPSCGHRTTEYGGSVVCMAEYCIHTSNRQCINAIKPEPDWWNTDINVQKDGGEWCAFYDGFINLQESKAAFGTSPQLAVDALRGLK